MNETQNVSPHYWLSLEQWRNDPEFRKLAEDEFGSSPLKESDGQDGWARREFLKLMGASLALTSFGCIRRPAQKIVPYAKAPPEITPGLPNYYTSTYVDSLEGFGIVVTTREGRPIKVEGQSEFPTNGHALSARAQAHVLSLWDPDRLPSPKRNLLNETKTNRDTINVSWDDADAEIVKHLGSGKTALLTGAVCSPTTRAAIIDIKSAYGVEHFQWEAKGLEGVAEGAKASFGQARLPKFHFEKAQLVVSIDCDFLGTFIAPIEFTRRFSKARKPGSTMTKLVAFESLMSLTGLNSDERHRIKPSQQVPLVMGLLHELIVNRKATKFAGDSALTSVVSRFAGVYKEIGMSAEQWAALVNELWNHRGQSLVVAGGMPTQTESSAALQAAVNLLNQVLENEGKTIDWTSQPVACRMTSAKEIGALVEGLEKGKYETLIIFGTNPVYSAPAGLKIADAIKKAKCVVYIEDRNDETGRISDFVLTSHHPMECWGDAEVQTGTISLQQPTLRPLYDSRSFEDNVIQWCKKANKGPQRIRNAQDHYDYLRAYWKSEIHPKVHGASKDFEEFWYHLLQTGFVETSAANSHGVSAKADLSPLVHFNSSHSEGYELSLYMTSGLADGTLANVSWLQEFPDPVTKVCWDNYVSISPKDAAREGLREGDVVILTASGTKVEVPAHIQPGQADGVLGLAVGYGRTGMGRIADNVGVNAYPLAVFKKDQVVYAGLPATLTKAQKSVALANTQGHHSMEGRELVIEATLAEFQANPSAGIKKEKIKSMWSTYEYPNHKWGMVIDLNSCTGCSACVVACQAENNIPVVGKKYVLRRREMHWIRIDRYYAGAPENPKAVFQPITCQHCDNAPCETVCPVLATVHSDEGTNDMIYNRCVGTRYCSNNCPYKVRRFNWFNYVKTVAKPLHNQLNPEVTVRARGVMEKCTFCTHKIHQAKSRARIEQREMVDGDVKTACQLSCPADAITFGDLRDEKSAVSRLFESERSYSLLADLNTSPALHYLTKIRNSEGVKGQHS